MAQSGFVVGDSHDEHLEVIERDGPEPCAQEPPTPLGIFTPVNLETRWAPDEPGPRSEPECQLPDGK